MLSGKAKRLRPMDPIVIATIAPPVVSACFTVGKGLYDSWKGKQIYKEQMEQSQQCHDQLLLQRHDQLQQQQLANLYQLSELSRKEQQEQHGQVLGLLQLILLVVVFTAG